MKTVTELTNMCMLMNGTKVLVQDRLGKDWRGIAFPGGHVEAGESITSSVVREMQEETGLTIQHPKLCGMKDWTREDGSRYIIFYYKADAFSGKLKPSAEGEVFWVELDELPKMNLAVDMDLTLQVLMEENLSEFYYKKTDGREEKQLL